MGPREIASRQRTSAPPPSARKKSGVKAASSPLPFTVSQGMSWTRFPHSPSAGFPGCSSASARPGGSSPSSAFPSQTTTGVPPMPRSRFPLSRKTSSSSSRPPKPTRTVTRSRSVAPRPLSQVSPLAAP